jgi:hypothetical protein
MESKKEFNSKVFRLVSVNAHNVITFEGRWRDIRKVRHNLLAENDKLIFDVYTKVTTKK